MAYEEKLLRRYLAVHALAERGASDGERFAAAKQRGAMEEKYPGIGVEALRLEAREKGAAWNAQQQASSPPPPPPPGPKPDPFGPFSSAGGNWGSAGSASGQQGPQGNKWAGFGDFIGEAWNFARDVTQTVVNAEAGRIYAERVVGVEGNQTAAGNYRLTAVTTVSDLMSAKSSLNDAQKQAFAKAVGDMIAAQMYALLSPLPGGRNAP